MKGNKRLSQYFSGLGRREFFNWMPDELYISILYKIKTGKVLNLNQPKSYNEKMQWLKLHDRKELYTTLTDKYLVKEYIAEKIGEEYIIPTLGKWERAEEIDFSILPNQFVIKCNHDSGSVIVCRDKSTFKFELARKKLSKRLKHTGYWYGREWPYKNIKPCIIAEKYIEDTNNQRGLTDYKFFCFNGEPKLLYVSVGLENHSTAQISFFDMKGKKMPFCRSDYQPLQEELILPANFEAMIEVARRLAHNVGNPFVRIDLYSVNEKIYFSEITFYPCNGIIPFSPIEWDDKLGGWIKLPFEI